MAKKKGELMPAEASAEKLIPAGKRESLTAWLGLYMGLEAGASSENTFRAKRRDLEQFLSYFGEITGTDHPDQWTRSVTSSFMRQLGKGGKKPTTVNRVLATLRHAAAWIHRQRPFLAGDPTDRIAELALDDPEWKGLTDQEVTRLRSAAEQMLKLKTGKNQNADRDLAIFLVLLHTGLRVSELLSLDLSQYEGKHFTNVKRKGKKVSRKVFIPNDAKDALDTYLEVRGKQAGPLFVSQSGERLARQHVHESLKALQNQANAQLKKSEAIKLSAHVLRHTMLRKTAEKFGVQYAMEAAGHTSSQYIWRYVKPTDQQREKKMEELYD